MGYQPPKGVRPPQLEGRRTGRPKGSRNHASVWADIIWGYVHRNEERGFPPTESAKLWWGFATCYPDEVKDYLVCFGKI